jgi:hypothetical protein
MGVAVFVIPIAIGVPAAVVFIPPPMVGAPAIFSNLVQFVARVLGLLAIPAVVFHGLVQPVIRPRQSPLAIPFVRTDLGRACEQQESGERGAG